MTIFRHAEVCGDVHYVAIVYRSAGLEEGRYSFQLSDDRRESYSSISATDSEQLSFFYGRVNVRLSTDFQFYSEYRHYTRA